MCSKLDRSFYSVSRNIKGAGCLDIEGGAQPELAQPVVAEDIDFSRIGPINRVVFTRGDAGDSTLHDFDRQVSLSILSVPRPAPFARSGTPEGAVGFEDQAVICTPRSRGYPGGHHLLRKVGIIVFDPPPFFASITKRPKGPVLLKDKGKISPTCHPGGIGFEYPDSTGKSGSSRWREERREWQWSRETCGCH